MTALTPLLAPSADDDADPAYRRVDARNNMFVTAILYGERGSTGVRIRNMSRSGALVESAVLPPEATQVRLVRGSLSVGGEIAWQGENRAGLRFDVPIEVSEWLPQGNKATSQQQVDEMIYACRTSPPRPLETGRTAPNPGKAEYIRQLHELKDAVAMVAGELAINPAIAIAHSTALQTLDVTAQRLDRLATLLSQGR